MATRYPQNSDIRELNKTGRVRNSCTTAQTELLRNEEERDLDRFMRSLYEAICFEDGGEPDWNRLAGLLAPHARFTRITPEGIDYLNFEDFRAMAEELVEIGAYTSFYEVEVSRSVRRFGRIAHVLSAYETKTGPAAVDCLARGVNSIQLVRDDEGWKLLSLFWDEETSDHADQIEQLFEVG